MNIEQSLAVLTIGVAIGVYLNFVTYVLVKAFIKKNRGGNE